MAIFLARRCVYFISVLAISSVLVFSMVHVLPGDPLNAVLGVEESAGLTAEQRDALRQAYGFNDPLHVQYYRWISRSILGDLGRSFRSNRPVVGLISVRLWPTVQLAILGLGLAVCLGLLLGIAAALYRGRWIDTLCMIFASAGVSLPVFWLGLMMIMVFSHQLRWLPSVGSGTWQHLIMPVVAVGVHGIAVTARLTRASVLEALTQDYVVTARAKGLREGTILFRHVLRNALIPVVTMIGLQFGVFLGGSVVVETVFSRPGLGRMLVTAIKEQDFPVIQGTMLWVAAMCVAANVFVDIACTIIDPRIRLDSDQ